MIPIFINGVQLRYFDELCVQVRDHARRQFIDGNRQIVRQDMRNYRNIPLNRRINDRYHIIRLNQSLQRLRALEASEAAVDRSILGNLSMFNDSGDYYLFSQGRFA